MCKKDNYISLTNICNLHFVGENVPTPQHPDPIYQLLTSKEKDQSNVFACFIVIDSLGYSTWEICLSMRQINQNLCFRATSKEFIFIYIYIYIYCRLKLGFILNAKLPDSA